MTCAECGCDKPLSHFYLEDDLETVCCECIEGFWSQMGDDPHGKGWEP